MIKNQNRQTVKLNYWRYVKSAPTRRYPSKTYEKRAIYVCTLCNQEFDVSVHSVETNHSTRCVGCSRATTHRRAWLLINLNTQKIIEVVNLKKWCRSHGVDSSTLYRTQVNTHPLRKKNFARDKQEQHWKIIKKLN